MAADAARADFIGFNFVPGARRQLGEDVARRIIQEYRERCGVRGPKLVGVFANQPLSQVNHILTQCGLDMAQLSGHEPMKYTLRVERPVIQAIHVPTDQPQDLLVDLLHRLLEEMASHDILPLLDPQVDNAPGGTGATFDWAIAQDLAPGHSFLLAGGLTPDNVAQAVQQVQPWGVDVSTGVETAGLKDPEKIRSFIQNARISLEDHE